MAYFIRTVCGVLYIILTPSFLYAKTPFPALKIDASIFGLETQWQNQKDLTSLNYSFDLPISNKLDQVDTAHTAYIGIAKGPWGGYIDKQYFKVSVEEKIEHIPLQIKAKLDRYSLGLYHTLENETHIPALTLAPTIGLHVNEASINVKAKYLNQTITASRNMSWKEPYIGLYFAYDISPKWTISGQTNIGSRNTKQFFSYISYHSKIMNKPTSIRLGLRHLEQKHQRDDFIWDIQEKSLTLGFSIQLL